MLARIAPRRPHTSGDGPYGALFTYMFAMLLVLPPMLGHVIQASWGISALAFCCAAMLVLAVVVDFAAIRRRD
jgi:hypothetical protein